MRALRLFMKIGIFLFISFVVVIVGLYTYAYLSPKLELRTAGQYYIYDTNDELVYQGSSTSEWVSLEDINYNLINAVISVEDKNFYDHHGFDYLRIIKAMYLNNLPIFHLSYNVLQVLKLKKLLQFFLTK